ncbi:GNAT family N-acetyltransferase [Streptomyces sp. NPDC087532]|uniref:GNAT family N-acetyltransferase n=1 Tax=Streptomyces sp. NPDC087532 TaxID=3365795 RepID=UPI0037F438C0
MTGPAQARLSAAGLSLWKTSYKYDLGNSWSGQRLIAMVGGTMAGHLDFFVHPDGQALSVFLLEVSPAHRGQGLASVLMDALYASYPTAWIDHGTRREPDGILWWDRYSEPARERNIHNCPPQEWAKYFDARHVFADKADNAARNRTTGVHGHRDAEYRYGERTEVEAQQHAGYFREATTTYADPTTQPLYGSVLLYLPPGLHRFVHDDTRDIAARAEALLQNVGHGNLPRAGTVEDFTGFWNTSLDAALADAAHAEAFQLDRPPQPSTHVAFRALPLDGDEVPTYIAAGNHVHYTGSADIPVQLSGLSWRTPARPWNVHNAAFSSPVLASLPPLGPLDATPEYRARYDLLGELRSDAPEPVPQVGPAHAPHGERIRALADKLIQDVAERTARPSAPPAAAEPSSTPQQAQQPLEYLRTSGRTSGPQVR